MFAALVCFLLVVGFGATRRTENKDKRLGVAYQLQNGEVVYVLDGQAPPDQADGQAPDAATPAQTP